MESVIHIFATVLFIVRYVALLEQDIFVTKRLVTFFHVSSFAKVLQLNIPCSAVSDYISCKHSPPLSHDGVPVLCVSCNDIKRMWADLLNQASVMFSYVWGYNYMHN
jgi:hypothetical protein